MTSAMYPFHHRRNPLEDPKFNVVYAKVPDVGTLVPATPFTYVMSVVPFTIVAAEKGVS